MAKKEANKHVTVLPEVHTQIKMLGEVQKRSLRAVVTRLVANELYYEELVDDLGNYTDKGEKLLKEIEDAEK